jgi:hypothetical protein
MKNITLAIEEDVLAAVRKYAAANNTTVNGLVRDYLGKIARQQNRAAQARKELVELAERSTWDPGKDWKWDREAVYDRGVFSRHEPPPVCGFQEPGAHPQEDEGD